MSAADQNSVDALLAQVQADVSAIDAAASAAPAEAAGAVQQAAADLTEIAGEMEPPAGAANPAPAPAIPAEPAPANAPSPAAASFPQNSDVHRLLAIEVPVIVQLGMRRLTVGEVMRLAVGAIVEFGKSAEEELDLLVNNKPIGKGHAVKVGENFGIKVTTIGSVRETIKKLGS